MAPRRTAKTSPSAVEKPKKASPKAPTKRVARSKSNVTAILKPNGRKRQSSSPSSPVGGATSSSAPVLAEPVQDIQQMDIDRDSPSVSPNASRGRNKGKGCSPPESSSPPRGFRPVLPPGAAPKPARGAPAYNQVPSIPTETGAVFVLGNGDCGQLGMGEDILERKRPMPLKVFDDKDIVKLAVGGLHTIALTKDGKLWSWGCNDQKALGRSGDDFEPGPVEGLDHEVIVHIACGDSISVALTAEGRVYTWGTFRNGEGILGFNKDQEVQAKPLLMTHLLNVIVVQVTVGTDHVLALTSTGDVYCWGNGQQCQLGRRIIPRRAQAGLVPERTNLKHIVKIGCGAYHSFAVSKEGFVYTWGLNNFQQCGLEADAGRFNEIISSPTIIGHEQLLGQGIRQCCGGEHHSAILREDGTVYVFGRADSQQLGLGYTVDLKDPTLSVFTPPDRAETEGAPAVSKKTAIGIPHHLTSLSNIETITIGSNHNVAIQRGGDAYAWGFGENYACGNGEDEDVPTPSKIEGQKLQNMRVIGVGAGAQHTVLLAQPRIPTEGPEASAMDTTN